MNTGSYLTKAPFYVGGEWRWVKWQHNSPNLHRAALDPRLRPGIFQSVRGMDYAVCNTDAHMAATRDSVVKGRHFGRRLALGHDDLRE
jgi:hypothetical protein